MHVAFLLPGRKTRNAVCPFSARAVSQSTLIKNLLGAARSKKKSSCTLQQWVGWEKEKGGSAFLSGNGGRHPSM